MFGLTTESMKLVRSSLFEPPAEKSTPLLCSLLLDLTTE